MLNKLQAGAKSMETIAVVCSHPAVPAAGDPVRYGERCGVALINEQTDGLTTIDISRSEYTLSVKGIDGAGNSAVVEGDLLYYVDADTPRLSKKNTGRLFGMARAGVTSGATATVRVFKFGW